MAGYRDAFLVSVYSATLEGTVQYMEPQGDGRRTLLQSAHNLRQEEHEWPRHHAKPKLEQLQIWASLNDPTKLWTKLNKNKSFRDPKYTVN